MQPYMEEQAGLDALYDLLVGRIVTGALAAGCELCCAALVCRRSEQ